MKNGKKLYNLVYQKDVDWIEKQLTKQYLGINLSIIKVEATLKIKHLKKSKNKWQNKFKKTNSNNR